MKKKTTLVAFALALLLISIVENGALFAQDQNQTKAYIDELIVQSIYIEGYKGSMILKIKLPYTGSEIKINNIYVTQITINSADEFNINAVNEMSISTKEFLYYIYTIYISANRKSASSDVNLLCKPLVLNISLIGQKDDLNLLYDNKLAIITVCSVKALEELKTMGKNIENLIKDANNSIEKLENRITTAIERVLGLEKDIKKMNDLIKDANNSIEKLENRITTAIERVLGLEKDIKKVNDSIAIKIDHLGGILETQNMLRLLTYVSLATSLASLSLLIMLVILISRARKEQLVLGL